MKALFEAIEKGDLGAIRRLKGKIDINFIGAEKQRTPLGLAVTTGNEQVVRLLLKFKDIDVNKEMPYFDKISGQISTVTPLGLAVLMNKPDILQILLTGKNINPSKPILHTNVTPLMQAVAQNSKDCRDLLYTITDPEHKDVHGWKVKDYLLSAEVAAEEGYPNSLDFKERYISTPPYPIQSFPAQTYPRQPSPAQSYLGQSYPRQPHLTSHYPMQPIHPSVTPTRTSLQVRQTGVPTIRNPSALGVSNPSVTVRSSELTSLRRRVEELEAKSKSQDEIIAELLREQQTYRAQMQNLLTATSLRNPEPPTIDLTLPSNESSSSSDENPYSETSSETITIPTSSSSHHPFFKSRTEGRASISFLLNKETDTLPSSHSL